MTDSDLITSYGDLVSELKIRGIIRTKNIVGDLGERFAIDYYCKDPILDSLTPSPPSTKSIDAVGESGKTYAIKSISAKVTGVFYGLPANVSNQAPVKLFDHLIIVEFSKTYEVVALYELTWLQFLKFKIWHSTMQAWYIPLNKAVKSAAIKLFIRPIQPSRPIALDFQGLVNLMGLTVNAKPTIYIENDPSLAPQWIISFVNSFINGEKTDNDNQVGLLDVLGTYNSAQKLITIYRGLINICASKLQVDPQILEDVVMAHELAHAASHLGIDNDGNIWNTFEEVEAFWKEYFAQWYAHTFFLSQHWQLHSKLMFALVKLQPQIYGTYVKDLNKDLSTMNSKLLSHRTGVHMIEELCEFCKSSIATEQVDRWDTWSMKSWTIPACSKCAPRNQQTWLT